MGERGHSDRPALSWFSARHTSCSWVVSTESLIYQLLAYMRINLRTPDVAVSHQLLNNANIGAFIEEMGCE